MPKKKLGPPLVYRARIEACADVDEMLKGCVILLSEHGAIQAVKALRRVRKSVQGAHRHAVRLWNEASRTERND